jgi:hypothetical protein
VQAPTHSFEWPLDGLDDDDHNSCNNKVQVG